MKAPRPTRLASYTRPQSNINSAARRSSQGGNIYQLNNRPMTSQIGQQVESQRFMNRQYEN